MASGRSPRFSLFSRAGRALRLRNLATVRFEGDAVRIRAATDAGVERVDRGQLILRELEAKDVEVLDDARELSRLRNGGATLLQMPAQHHLRGGLLVLAADL